jgi:hypothetical protein
MYEITDQLTDDLEFYYVQQQQHARYYPTSDHVWLGHVSRRPVRLPLYIERLL